jgi:hypothetical protein
MSLAWIALISAGCSTASPDESCDECRQQNAPLESALNMEVTYKSSANLEAAPKANLKESEVQTEPGFAPQSVENAGGVKSSPAIEDAAKRLIDKQANDI